MKNYWIEKIFIDSAIRSSRLSQRIQKNAGDIPVESIGQGGLDLAGIQLKQGKRILYITSQAGGLVKPCPATNPPYLCCQYTTIHAMTQCPFDCSYCVLQGYLESPVITLFANESDIFDEIDQLLLENPKRFFRFGTGELADSLALDNLTQISLDYLEFFRERKNALIELKTKSVNINNLHSLAEKPKHAVISWSVNPDEIIRKEEFRAATLDRRLEAARVCEETGYLLGFHFDPILSFEGWEEKYEQTIERIFDSVSAQRVAWISLGSLRFPAEFKNIIRERFPESEILYEEMIRGMDGKMRYPRPLRTELYEKVVAAIRKHAPDVFVYFCMESPEVWDAVMGKHPKNNADLDFWFARDIWQRFGSEFNMDEPRPEFYLNLL